MSSPEQLDQLDAADHDDDGCDGEHPAPDHDPGEDDAGDGQHRDSRQHQEHRAAPAPAFTVERNKIVTRQVKTLTVHYPDPRPGEHHRLDMLYFRPGIRWIPTYRIELLDEDTARIAMQAEILNEAEDFENTPVDFVVGVPTFKFADVVSPLTLERIMVDTLAQSAPQLMGQLSGQAM